jgi:hypothetical protein
MAGNRHLINILLIFSLLTSASSAIAKDTAQWSAPQVGVGSQYDTTHVYVAPEDVDKLVASFLATFGGQSTKQVVATAYGRELTGYEVKDLQETLAKAKASGATVLAPHTDLTVGLQL